MKRLTRSFPSSLIVAAILVSAMLVSATRGSGNRPMTGELPRRPISSAILSTNSQSSAAPHITSLQLFFIGKAVSHLIIGTKAKRYTMKIIGEGFDQSARVVVDGMKARVASGSSTEVDAGLKGGTLMFPGEVAVRVVNPDGQTSNDMIIEVVSDPSILSITTITPDFGPAGTQVTITGLGFAPKGNHVRLLRSATDLVGVTSEVDSSDGRTIAFSLPDFICPPCSLSVPPCAAPCFAVTPGEYDVFVINENGMSNSLGLLVSSPAGPIGFWGIPGLSVEVTDTQVMISGLCFVGQIPETLTTDATGNFKLTGTITPMIGPVGLARPAAYQGTISGNVMTFTITDGSSTLGPYTVTFGVEEHVVHPCA